MVGTRSMASGDRVVFQCEKSTTMPKVCVGIASELASVRPAEIVFDHSDSRVHVRGTPYPLSAVDRGVLKQMLPKDRTFTVVIDEVDLIEEPQTLEDLAHLAKMLSDQCPNVHLVVVGVADNANQLLKGHQSTGRNLRQVQLDRMPDAELREILAAGLDRLQMSIDDNARAQLITTADRFPHYLHLLAKWCAREAIERGDTCIRTADLPNGMRRAAKDADNELRESYELATSVPHNGENCRRVLTALAWADRPRMSVADLTLGVNANTSRLPLSKQSVAWALKKLAAPSGGAVVKGDKSIWRFQQPMMRAFVRLQSEEP